MFKTIQPGSEDCLGRKAPSLLEELLPSPPSPQLSWLTSKTKHVVSTCARSLDAFRSLVLIKPRLVKC